ncbi:hypothetical protein [Methanobacterium sp. BAmetb5]|uniref:hypothetical protein n=1 Tax=Methanobacterium sp. BAmetb5 TaxID=2025351 RepID=UPI000E8F57D5|nr:hypothetical protein [Methanobacterium sp. BAmetb5]AXV40384.1 MAG: hypothetical protein CIT02_08660 [Methanobacterium sp. BAmetb5]
MRVSEGIPRGRKVHLYHPELLSDHEEVIIYTRDEFKRNYLAMREYIDYAFKQYSQIDSEREFELTGHWARIMERIHFINVDMDLFLDKKPSQAYLDTYVKIPVDPSDDLLAESTSNVPAKSLGVNWL